MSTYRNITINGVCYLCAVVKGKTYILGRTGLVGNCQDPSRMQK